MQNKNFFVAMALIAGFLILWSVFVIPRFTPKPTAVPAATSTSAPEAFTPAPELSSAHAKMGQPIVTKDTILRDENNEIVLTSKGGAIKNWRVKLGNEEVDLVLHPEAENLPLTTFADVSFQISVQGKTATLRGSLPNGLRVIKTLTLAAHGYLHQVTVQFQNPTKQQLELANWSMGWGPGIGADAGELKENPRLIRVISFGKLKVKKVKVDEPVELGKWAAIDNRYYLAAFVPKQDRSVLVKAEGTKEHASLSLVDRAVVGPSATETIRYELYVGPKGHTQLKAYDRGLEESVDFGTFAWLGKKILEALYWLNKRTGNFGVAIILLTVGIQFLMLPLSLKSFKATMSMKKLQPKIAELQARFKADPKRLNIEMMNLYKNSKTNPFGGCLPMLLQLPIFLALFNAIRNAYELRGAPFVGWIHDLSAPDILFRVGSFPIHALPLIMGVAMYLQQRLAGAVTDPTQRQMMTMMPVMFTFMFYGFPSGLVLYWLTNNLMTMGSQWSFQRLHRDDSGVIEATVVKE